LVSYGRGDSDHHDQTRNGFLMRLKGDRLLPVCSAAQGEDKNRNAKPRVYMDKVGMQKRNSRRARDAHKSPMICVWIVVDEQIFT